MNHVLRISLLSVSVLFFALCPNRVLAQEVIFTEDFSQDFSQWQLVRDHFEAWNIVDGQAEVYLDQPFQITELVPKDEYWNQAWQNLELELDYQPLMGVDKNISFGFQNLNHWYEIHFAEDFFNLVKLKNGTTPFDIIRPYILRNGEVYRIKIRFETGLIHVFINGTEIAAEFDSTFDHDYGKIGLKVSTGAIYPTLIRFDNILVRRLPTNDSTIPLKPFKQNDPLWRGETYDTATRWSSNPTIARWGCALTSMVMIMQYYGITALPNGQLLSPSSLNGWLLSQPDGYIGEGLVNWLAVTRLTKAISLIKQTPALEFSVVTQNILERAHSELIQQRPVILNIPGHFLVANGLVSGSQDNFSIIDPLYTYNFLADHQQPLLSLRTFMPSHTDLSYILIGHARSVSVGITPIGVQNPLEIITTEEFIQGETEETQPYLLHYVAKPSSSVWELALKSSTPQDITILTYDSEGTVRDLSLKRFMGSDTLKLEFNPVGVSTLSSPLTLARIRSILELLYEQHHIYRYYSYLILNQILWWAEKSSSSNQLRYLSLFEYHLSGLSTSLSSNAQTILSENLAHFKSQKSALPP